jgi:hypothetical protein
VTVAAKALVASSTATGATTVRSAPTLSILSIALIVGRSTTPDSVGSNSGNERRSLMRGERAHRADHFVAVLDRREVVSMVSEAERSPDGVLHERAGGQSRLRNAGEISG